MIKLNLLDRKKAAGLPTVLGMDLNKVNLKAVIISLVVLVLPPHVIDYIYVEKINTINQNLASLNAQSEIIKKEIESNEEVRTQLESYKAQVKKLEMRSRQVDEILQFKSNPKKVLEKVARSIPDDVWIESLSIDKAHDFSLKGGADSARSIGEFITIVNDSPYFGGTLTPTRQENVREDSPNGVSSYESFELRGRIINYDMRGN